MADSRPVAAWRRRHRVGALALLLAGTLLMGALPANARVAATGRVTPLAGSPGCTIPAHIQVATPAMERARLNRVKAVNYYPAQNGWQKMWTDWHPDVINRDFQRIASLHANSVRIILQAGVIGYPTPQPVMLSHLAQVIALAHRHHLTVELTLFDWWSSYDDLAGSKRWACTVLKPYAGDKRIAFIELQNETDARLPHALTWLAAMAPYVRAIDGGIPVALSAYRLDDFQAMAGAVHPDLFSYHIIAGAEYSYATMRTAIAAVAPTPLYIGEEGFSTLPRWADSEHCSTGRCAEALQEHEFRTIAYAARRLGLPPVAPWILNDFAPHSLTWDPPAAEYDFGLFRLNGAPKVVARSVAAYFGAGTISTSFNNGFETAVGGLPAEWRIFHGSQAQFARDNTVAYTGRASVRISRSTSDPTGGPSFFISPIAPLIVPGRRYQASVWARGLAATGETRMALAWFDASGNFIGQVQSPTLSNGTTSWTLLTVEGTAPRGAGFVQIHLKSFNNHGVAWFDDVTFSGAAEAG